MIPDLILNPLDPAQAVANEQLLYLLSERLKTENVSDRAITSTKRQLLSEITTFYGNIPPNSKASAQFLHGLGFYPLVVPIVKIATLDLSVHWVWFISANDPSFTEVTLVNFGSTGTLVNPEVTVQFY